MEKYIAPEMEIVEFEAEDVITTSCSADLPFCSSGSPDDGNEDMW
ncbi:MAG: hypothetical protein ACI4K7_03170 [Oscillospiraceae bacterium]